MKLVHVQDDLFDFLGGKGMQAAVRIGPGGEYEVVGPPRRPSKHCVSGYSLDNVRCLLARMDPEYIVSLTKSAREFRGGVRF